MTRWLNLPFEKLHNLVLKSLKLIYTLVLAQILKWKPASMNSVDFRLQVVSLTITKLGLTMHMHCICIALHMANRD